MPWGYAVTVAGVALCVASAIAPFRSPRALARLSWVLGMIPNELPFVVLAYLGAASFIAGWQGDLSNALGLVTLAVAALTAAALVVVVWRATQAKRVMRGALRSDLGATLPARPIPWLSVLFAPFTVTSAGVSRRRDIAYGPAKANRLDLYERRSGAVTGPILIHFHGGGFRGGGKSREARPLLMRLARNGWLCVSANYRLRPAPYDDSLADAKAVVEWCRTHASERGLDDAAVFVAGSSAGAHLALTTACDDPTIMAAIGLYGYYGPADDRRPETAPAAHLGPNVPPIFVAHGDLDTYVEVEQARGFVAIAREVSERPVVYAELPGGQHSFDLFRSIRFERVIDGIEAFAALAPATRR